ncbi:MULTISPECIES: M23 family metallopeptidase [unclassified Nocardia]|uniref:M23 family metallopeptidase n=1 Tax=unclassified Nocardia TaxID=2637762 RepID=UPI002E0EF6B8|nr:M23 family metallopeptidase [Nocardia sp. NBC_01327]
MRLIVSIVLGWLVLLTPQCLAAPGAAAPISGFDWPLRPRPAVVRAFDKPERDWLPGHRGVDLGGSPGQQVLAAGDGTVAFAGIVAGKPVLSIDHTGGLRTTYEPVKSSLPLGRRVIRGMPIGELQSGHDRCPVSACLHWGLRRGHDYLDPLGLVRHGPIRLQPLASQSLPGVG